MSSRDADPDRSVEVCREFLRQRCHRSDGSCRFAHPPSNCHVINGRVTCCVDFIKGRCQRPSCRYYHPPQHIGDELLRATSDRRPSSNQRPPLQHRSSRAWSPPPSSPSSSRDLILPPLPPGLSMLKPELADILQGYKNALDTALMATKLISSSQASSSRQPEPSPRRTDAIEVCRQFLRGNCTRKEEDCRFAHPPANVSVSRDNEVTACIDFIKGRCNHDPCRYFHPPDHLKAHIYLNPASRGGAPGGARKRTYGSGSSPREDRDRRYKNGDDSYQFAGDEPPYKRGGYGDRSF